ncbi:MAG: Hsp20/alpha crystallin family protein [candidate division WOR-3 bacterium]|nr:MAG: Hsp20/alpha crystallin family protein [candidate division WOR-3 bacterium]
MKHPASKKDNVADIRFITNNEAVPEEHGSFSALVNWQPLYNLYTVDDTVVVHLELAGVDLQDVVIFLRSRYMFIEGNRIAPTIIEEHCVFHNLEIPYGRFMRRIDFPMPVETRQYRYEMRNGVLTIQFKVVEKKIIPVEGE